MLPAATAPTAQVEAAGAGPMQPVSGVVPIAGQKRLRISARDPRIGSAAAAGASCAAIGEAEGMDLTGGSREPETAKKATPPAAPMAAAQAGPAAAAVNGPAPAAAPNPPASLAFLQLPPLSSFADDSGRPLKRRMLSKLQPLLELAGASDQQFSVWSSEHDAGARMPSQTSPPLQTASGKHSS